ncbi:Excreted virulence factor EspC, type VII ESX diderm [Saccharopolyspora antimicrobica]|uniref:Excreted virulence factor EspC (Type VII ESX diderm) n=1 Tax=Saccharopolyspora antimicrobica TaxID=455193 RepID=A0A1I5DNR8_9PSEU|nr:ESX-1 secretion-associated protein [Saccharopolyspora antimicrobica]RKT85046.1 excreted virulence factor EspC (type VII ESX diderm) [Saccharopolyspora antimicrobica]SFO00816.1 Excreted virulence factor EspC, type VII ESX diderm [Saccharopolyspora antimicrobica]
MPDEMNVVIENLRSHASKVDGVVDQLNVAVDASQQVSLNNDAYGILCRPFAWMIDPVEQYGIETLQKSVEAMQEVAENVRGAAEDYQAVDDDNSDAIGSIEV